MFCCFVVIVLLLLLFCCHCFVFVVVLLLLTFLPDIPTRPSYLTKKDIFFNSDTNQGSFAILAMFLYFISDFQFPTSTTPWLSPAVAGQ